VRASILAYVVSGCFLVLGVVQGVTGYQLIDFWSFNQSFLVATVGFLIGTVYVILSERGFRQSNPGKFVTWNAFITVLVGSQGEFFSVSFWVIFYLGKIMGALGI